MCCLGVQWQVSSSGTSPEKQESRMTKFEDLKKKAELELKARNNETDDTPMFRGIGYALLALAQAIQDKKK